MQTIPVISNKQARRLWLSTNLLLQAPTGPLDVYGIIHSLGFVQLDTIQVVARAHHHILWSRNQAYREHMLNPLLADERRVFEHFTHDASVIPMEFLPMWQRQFQRFRAKFANNGWFKNMSGPKERAAIKARIAAEGALSTHAFDSATERPKEMWARPAHKKALDYMWYVGELATCHRRDFVKFYNLPENVFPDHRGTSPLTDAAQLDWLCRAALMRLGFGTQGEVQRFWDAASAKEIKGWLGTALPREVMIEGADGSLTRSFAADDIEARLDALTPPSTRLRILNPFDPAVRDRARLERLFGFEYRNEMFVPAAKRKWGYYVYPILEGDRFVGRIELKAERKSSTLTVVNFWSEPGVRWSTARQSKLDSELRRLARFVGCQTLA
ncbi:crosslink repair DNA glycosylase YcaQ family protein [Cognatishimia sp. SS12]|uniref:winged helix-turn-helix domain-containing protein n=1 Tax=Cognatishimia sp. SS12 TaxID=2979465 RepID=UPI00232D5422|nr:crosslink repair DNA glycosylase YcaQ family protein [Cognatishimia sp. SS12]MDC0737643.1 crosslink repair DNA glycosylase YcaQ family protein [Cognatishimia sp. SS12]